MNFPARTLLAALAVLAVLAGVLPARGAEPGPHSMQSRLDSAALDGDIQPDDKSGIVTDGVLVLRGPIDRAMRERFFQVADSEHVTTVRITSQGGDIVEALGIADGIQQRGINVTVHGLCTGACAQYILVAGKQRRLEKDSLVGFMGTIKSSGMLLGMAIELFETQNRFASSMNQATALEEDLYRRSGVSPTLLMDPAVAMQPRCMTLERGDRGVRWTVVYNYIMWVPTRAYLEAAGLKFEGNWPKSSFTLGGLTFDYLKLRSSVFVRFSDKDPRKSRKDRPYSLDQLRNCVVDVERPPGETSGQPGTSPQPQALPLE